MRLPCAIFLLLFANVSLLAHGIVPHCHHTKEVDLHSHSTCHHEDLSASALGQHHDEFPVQPYHEAFAHCLLYNLFTPSCLGDKERDGDSLSLSLTAPLCTPLIGAAHWVFHLLPTDVLVYSSYLWRAQVPYLISCQGLRAPPLS
ncbi:MAG: hypothetical protein ACRC9X_08320 [Bacteroidales bacterium]